MNIQLEPTANFTDTCHKSINAVCFLLIIVPTREGQANMNKPKSHSGQRTASRKKKVRREARRLDIQTRARRLGITPANLEARIFAEAQAVRARSAAICVVVRQGTRPAPIPVGGHPLLQPSMMRWDRWE